MVRGAIYTQYMDKSIKKIKQGDWEVNLILNYCFIILKSFEVLSGKRLHYKTKNICIYILLVSRSYTIFVSIQFLICGFAMVEICTTQHTHKQQKFATLAASKALFTAILICNRLSATLYDLANGVKSKLSRRFSGRLWVRRTSIASYSANPMIVRFVISSVFSNLHSERQ